MVRRISTVVIALIVVASLVAGPVATAQTGASLSITGGVAFVDTDGAVTGNTSIEVRLDTAVDQSSISPGDVEIGLRDGSSTQATGIEPGAVENDSQFVVDAGRLPVSSIETIGFDDAATIEGVDGTTYDGGDIDEVSVTRATTTLTEGDAAEDRPAFRGETVALVGDDANEELLIRSADTGDLLEIHQVPDDGQVYAFDPSGLEADAYAIGFDGDTGSSDDRLLELLEYQLDVRVNPNPNVGDATVTDTENVTGTVSTNRVDQALSVSVLDGEEVIRSTRVRTNGTGEATFDFAPIELDEADDHFTVVARHEPSGTTAVDPIKVSQVDYDAGFETLGIEEERGDVVEIPIVMSPDVGDKVAVDRATVTIGSPDVSYRANVTVSDWNDDQLVVLRWNTYLADGDGGADEFSVEPTDDDERDDAITVDDVESSVGGGPDDILDSGTYEITVRSGAHAADEPANTTGSIFLTDRETSGLNLSTAPTDDDVPLRTFDDISDARADGELTGTEAIASGDRAVFELEASGIGGAIVANESANETVRFDRFLQEAASMTTVQTNPGPNQAPKTLDVTGSSIRTVVVHETNDTYYVVMDPDAAQTTRDENGNDVPDSGEPVVSLEDGDQFETTFEIEESDGGLADDPENVSVTWEYQDPTATVDRTRVDTERVAVVEPAASQFVTGTTNVAPGTELTVRVRDDADDWAYLDQRAVVVAENGTWSAEFSFDDAPPETPLTISVRHGSEELTTADGLVRSERTTDTTGSATATNGTDGDSTADTTSDPDAMDQTAQEGYRAEFVGETATEGPTTTSTPTADTSSNDPGVVPVAVLAGTLIVSTVGWVLYRRK